MERWVGRVAIVTGASAGIGADIACLLAEQGMKVVAVARREERVKELIAQLGQVKGEIHALSCDVTKEEDVTRVVTWTRETLGGADVLVNNAGVNFPGHLTEISTSDMQKILNTNILGLSMLTRDVISDMRQRGVDDGHIFHIGSAVGQRIHDYPGICMYSASKHAVRVLTEGLRRELRDLKTNIRITSRAATIEKRDSSKSLRIDVEIDGETFVFGLNEYSISPGITRSDIMVNGGASQEESDRIFADNPCLDPRDVSNALLYALTQPPKVQVHELTIMPLGEKY